jgi:diaminopimelate decarboxylase
MGLSLSAIGILDTAYQQWHKRNGVTGLGRQVWTEWFGSDKGELTISGMAASKLAERYGTPLYVYDLSIVQKKYEMIKEALAGFDVFYSVKANPNMHIVKRLMSLGAGLEIASAGELFLARKAGVSTGDIIFAGPGKTDSELRGAMIAGIHAINVESVGELRRIEAIADELQKDVAVALRINTLQTADSAPERMVGGPSKFGFDEESVVSDLSSISLKRARIIGIHVYAASGVLDVDELLAHFKRTLELAVRLSEEIGFSLRFIDFGGGFGVPYSEGQAELDLKAYAAGVQDVLAEESKRSDLGGIRLAFELGRYLVAECGVYLTRVIDVKQSRGSTFIITDGGMNHFVRPAFVKVEHPAVIATDLDGTGTTATVGGPLCTPIDVLVSRLDVGSVKPGDLVAVFNTGAYGYSMSMLHFLSHPLPAEVVIDRGVSVLARKRGGVEDALIHQVSY